MFRTLVLLISVVLAVSANAAISCPPAELKIKDLTLNSNGVITRNIIVVKEADGQKGKRGEKKNVSVARDVLQIEQGDRLILNADPLAIDAIFEVEVAIEDKEYDEAGVMNASYRVRETTYFTFGSIKYKAAEKTYLSKITSNYLGNGVYGKTCGQVEISELDVADMIPKEDETGETPEQK